MYIDTYQTYSTKNVLELSHIPVRYLIASVPFLLDFQRLMSTHYMKHHHSSEQLACPQQLEPGRVRCCNSKGKKKAGGVNSLLLRYGTMLLSSLTMTTHWWRTPTRVRTCSSWLMFGTWEVCNDQWPMTCLGVTGRAFTSTFIGSVQNDDIPS